MEFWDLCNNDNDLAVTNTEVSLKEDTNSKLNTVDIDDQYWKEVRNNPIIVTNRSIPEINLSQRIWTVFDRSLKFWLWLKNMDLMFYDNDSSIDNEPDIGNTVIYVDNKFGVIWDNSDAASPLPLPLESSP